MTDEPADVLLVCALCPERFAVEASAVSPDAMATVVAGDGTRVWLALCPACSDFLHSRS